VKKGALHILELKDFLDEKAEQFNRPGFIENDPVSIPHRFTKKQDIEIAGLFAAVLAWGQRPTIIRKSQELIGLMDDAPYDFMLNHNKSDLRRFDRFVHRTFQPLDARYFIAFISTFYKQHESLEEAFLPGSEDTDVEHGLVKFHELFSKLAPQRSKKHVSSPAKKSACKRLNMFLRWMVRQDTNGVDFGIWKSISPAQLVCPCDLHVERVARKLKLMRRKNLDWKAAIELTESLRLLDAKDPVKYDFALFGLGIDGFVKKHVS
jgi:uncharacterized protein (TIGR02757 family)